MTIQVEESAIRPVERLERRESLPQQLLEPGPHRRGLGPGEPDDLGGRAEGEVEGDGLVEVAADPDRQVAAAEHDVGEPGREQLAAQRVGVGLRERPGAAAGLVGLLGLVDERLDDLLGHVEPGVVELAPPDDQDELAPGTSARRTLLNAATGFAKNIVPKRAKA